jgi:hypothetical protein
MATFTGTASLTTTNSHVPGPYTEQISMALTFNSNQTQFTIGTFPNISGPAVGQPPISTPLGNDTYSLSLTPGIPGNGTGSYNSSTGELTLNLTLHLHNSVHILSPGDLDSDFAFTGAQMMTTETCFSQDGSLRYTGSRVNPTSGGQVLLVGATKFTGGYLGGSDCGLTINGIVADIVPQTQTPPTFNSLTFNITTGGDDLRNDSSATASVMINGANQTFTLKKQTDPGWGNNSDNIRTFTINGPAQPVTAFGPISITLTSHNSGFETNDNWNIQAVTVTATGPNNASTLLRTDSGNPFKRLTGSAPTATL